MPPALRIGAAWVCPACTAGVFYSVRRTQMWCLSVSGAVDAQAARRGLQQGGDCVRRLFKLLVIRAYLLDLLPARTVVLAFRLFDLKHE